MLDRYLFFFAAPLPMLLKKTYVQYFRQVESEVFHGQICFLLFAQQDGLLGREIDTLSPSKDQLPDGRLHVRPLTMASVSYGQAFHFNRFPH